MKRLAVCVLALALLGALGIPTAGAAGNPMKLVGALNPWTNGQFSNVAADAARAVGYLGSFDDQGVAVIKTTDPAHPVLTDVLSTHITSETQTSDSADLDLVGRYLAVSHQPWTDGGFSGISIYDTAADPYNPTLLRGVALPGGIHTVQLDPDVESGRPYAYANAFEFGPRRYSSSTSRPVQSSVRTNRPSRRGATPRTRIASSSTRRMRDGCSEAPPGTCSTTSLTGTAACGSWM
jgi:hypothetical protein